MPCCYHGPSQSQQPAAGLTRRGFLKRTSSHLAAGALAAGFVDGTRAAAAGRDELRITRIIAQDAHGRRATPVAPNAFAPYRGYDCNEPLLRIQTNQGIEGISNAGRRARRDTLRTLIGLNPFELFAWEDDCYAGPSEKHRGLVGALGGIDLAVFDILGKATGRPVADLFGPRLRHAVEVYDSTLYMDDLLTPEQREGLVYLEGRSVPDEDAEMVARKAEWLINDYYRREGLRLLKIKTGRARWMDSWDEALERDIAVFRAVREVVGPFYTLFVDVNNGYEKDYTAAKRFIEATSHVNLFGIEEMFDESNVEQHREVVEHAWSLGLHVRNIDGEGGGLASRFLSEAVETPLGERPLFDIDNPSFSHGRGFVDVAAKAGQCRRYGMLVGPHNFASKIGFYASVHMGFSVPNWAYAEIDDCHFPGLRLTGVEIRNGQAHLTGVPGLGIELDEEKLSAPRFEIG